MNAVGDTAGAQAGTYHIFGQVLYDSKAGEPKVVDVHTKVRLYLPCVLHG